MSEITPTTVRALCCECGNLRTVSANYRRRDGNHSHDDGRDPRGWRMTTTLKCAACKEPTRHALLRDDTPFRNRAEKPAPRRHHGSITNTLRGAVTATMAQLDFEDLSDGELLGMLESLTAAHSRLHPPRAM